MKLQKLLQGLKVVQSSALKDMEIKAVRFSSREVEPGDLFVAVTGFATDGHKYIADAVTRGAAVIVCERQMPENTPWVQVENSRLALAQLGVNYYDHPAEKMTMIGVTGTNGKTSVTYLLKQLLEKALGAKVGLIGTICNMIGEEEFHTERTTPESLELQALLAKMQEAGCTHVIMEVSSHALALHRVAGIHYRVGAFTNLTEDHLDFHKDMEDYRQAKAKLFSMCDKGVFNLDDPVTIRMMEDARCGIHTIGTGENAQVQGRNIYLGSDHIEMDVTEGDTQVQLRLGIPGRFTVSNALLTLGMARQLGIDLEDAVRALSKAEGIKGRIEVVPTPGKDYTVLIDYAHTPDGLENILRSVRDFCKGRLIALFGCGGDRDRKKRPVMGEIAARCADLILVTSDNPRTEEPDAIIEEIMAGVQGSDTHCVVEPDRRKAIRMALQLGQKDDIIVLAGKGHETYQIVGKEKLHLDEREEVALALWEERQ